MATATATQLAALSAKIDMLEAKMVMLLARMEPLDSILAALAARCENTTIPAEQQGPVVYPFMDFKGRPYRVVNGVKTFPATS